MLGEFQYLFQHPYRAQGFGAFGAPSALLPVAQAGDADLDTTLGEVLPQSVQGEPARADGGTQREVEGPGTEYRRQLGLDGVLHGRLPSAWLTVNIHMYAASCHQ
ncbi:hypothetical protein GCM10009664_46860 [Kitasatospora gansuensis]